MDKETADEIVGRALRCEPYVPTGGAASLSANAGEPMFWVRLCGDGLYEGPSETVKFVDESTADPVEKARRYLKAMGDQRMNSAYFFDDGYPRRETSQDAIATLAVLEQLAAAPATQPAPAAQGDARAEQALLKVLTAVQRYLPPDGPSAKDTLAEIIGIIDPWPLGDQKGQA